MSYDMVMDSIRDAASDYGPGWIAQNKYGNWYWYENEPESNLKHGYWESSGREFFLRECDIFRLDHWANSLEEV